MSAGQVRQIGRPQFAQVPNAYVLDPTIPDRTLRFWMTLATYTNLDSIFPGHAAVAEVMGCTRRTVIRAQEDAIERGMLMVDQRPGTSNVYTLVWPGCDTADTGDVSRVSQVGVSPVSPDTEPTDTEPPSLKSIGTATVPVTLVAHMTDLGLASPDLFDAFWEAYPRKVGKPRARAAWDKAIRKTPPQVIVAGAVMYDSDPNREAEFTAHPTTWLNREGWNDDPLPARGGARRQQPRDPMRGRNDVPLDQLLAAALASPDPMTQGALTHG